MRLRRLCLEIFALRRFFKEPIAERSVCRASEAQPKHRLFKMATAFAAKSRKIHRRGRPFLAERIGQSGCGRDGLVHDTRIRAWSGWWDLNPRPLRPERSALPS